VPRAADSWVRHVRGARRFADVGVPYLEVRYEALRGGDVAGLAEVHRFCGLDVDETACRALLESFSFERMAANDEDEILVGGEFAPHVRERREPEGFFRKGAVGGWRAEWSGNDRLLFDAVAGDLLVSLGYEPDDSWAGGAREHAAFRRSVRRKRAVAAVARRIGRRGNRVLRGLP
jgi:hypothetical protein